MTVKLIRGRSKRSHLVIAGRALHCFVWVPWTHGSDSTGITLRFRRGARWTHLRLVLLQRNHPPGGWRHKTHKRYADRGGTMLMRPTLTLFEISRWDTAPGTQNRVGLKSYVRLKISLGGHQMPG